MASVAIESRKHAASLPSPPLPNYGDPLAKLITGSGGPGGGGGIGTGEGGGIGIFRNEIFSRFHRKGQGPFGKLPAYAVEDLAMENFLENVLKEVRFQLGGG